MLKVSTADILVLNINMACINLRFENLNYHNLYFGIVSQLEMLQRKLYNFGW